MCFMKSEVKLCHYLKILNEWQIMLNDGPNPWIFLTAILELEFKITVQATVEFLFNILKVVHQIL